MYNYEYRVVVIGDTGVQAIKFYDAFSAFNEYKHMKEQHPDAFVTIEMREVW